MEDMQEQEHDDNVVLDIREPDEGLQEPVPQPKQRVAVAASTSSGPVEPVAECPICTLGFNQSLRAAVTCEFGNCKYMACKTCVRMYLMHSTNEPHCMHCRKPWTLTFTVQHLNRSFMINEYKEHQRKLLLEREISKMPETMHLIAFYREIPSYQERVEEKVKQLRVLEQQMNVLNRDINEDRYRLRRLEQRYERMLNGEQVPPEVTDTTAEGAAAKRSFIMPCTFEGCKGFLSSQYKCDVCLNFTCSKCHEQLGPSRLGNGHACKPENIESAQLIKQETKPCPSCGTRIFKISGCDQMWCTNCHKAFSWKTGIIDQGFIHNPHFFQYNEQRRAQGQADNLGCQNNNEDQLVDWYSVSDKLRYLTGTPHEPMCRFFRELYNNVAHQVGGERRTRQARVEEVHANGNVRFRVSYLMSQLTGEELGKIVYKRSHDERSLQAQNHIWELLLTFAKDMFRRIVVLKTPYYDAAAREKLVEDVMGLREEWNTLLTYCNAQFKEISLTYNISVPQVNENGQVRRRKFLIREGRKKKDEANDTADNAKPEKRPKRPSKKKLEAIMQRDQPGPAQEQAEEAEKQETGTDSEDQQD
jgi:hypothetical protein